MSQPSLEQVRKAVEQFFEPCIRLYWRGRFGKSTRNWHPDTLQDRAILRQFLDEAGFRGQGPYVTEQQYDEVLAAAGAHGYSIETIGDPELTPA